MFLHLCSGSGGRALRFWSRYDQLDGLCQWQTDTMLRVQYLGHEGKKDQDERPWSAVRAATYVKPFSVMIGAGYSGEIND